VGNEEVESETIIRKGKSRRYIKRERNMVGMEG
jgi:hypothetical protein